MKLYGFLRVAEAEPRKGSYFLLLTGTQEWLQLQFAARRVKKERLGLCNTGLSVGGWW